MRTILKHFIIDTVCLYIVSQIVSGVRFENGIQTLFLTGAVLTLATLIIRPVLNILLLPLNLITFGLFKWVTHTITLYLVTLIVLDFKILSFNFNGYVNNWFSIPHIYLTGILAFIAFSFLISFVSSIIYWIFK